MTDGVKTAELAGTADDSGAVEMGRILAIGTLSGIPVWFVIATMICRVVGVSWSGSAAIGAWGALVGGPFFGAMLFFARRVSDLSH